MYQYKNEQTITTEQNEQGIDKLLISNLTNFAGKNPKLRTFALAQLKPGEEVGFHIHEGECEYYYILSGKGVYNDNGTDIEAVPGLVTFTPAGTGHGIKNTGEEMLEFIALIILE